MNDINSSYVEKALRFGLSDSLVGVLTLPTNSKMSGHPAAILLNAGLLHRVGIQRMNVELARMLSKIDIISFRVDLYGIGDSSSLSGKHSFRERAFEDICQTMTYLSNKIGVNKFILIGHCAGADNAYKVIVEDERVVGGVLIDAFGYPTLRFKLKDIGGASMVNPIKWFKYLIRNFLAGGKKKNTLSFMEDYGRSWPSCQDAERDLLQTLNRGVHLLYIYTGGVAVYYNHHDQFYSMFKSLQYNEHLEVLYYKNADHNLTQSCYREKALNSIIEWHSNKFNHQ